MDFSRNNEISCFSVGVYAPTPANLCHLRKWRSNLSHPGDFFDAKAQNSSETILASPTLTKLKNKKYQKGGIFVQTKAKENLFSFC